VRERWYPLILVLVLAVSWRGSLGGAFVFDDEATVLKNELLGPAGGFFRAPPDSPLRDRPVAAASLGLNYLLGGRNPLGYHLVNLLIHLAAALALYGIVRRTLRKGAAGPLPAGSAAAAALAAALLWGLHPLQTESVTYITQRCESLSGMFYLLTLYLFIRGAGSSRPGPWHGFAVLCCFLGVGTKATAVTIPIAILVYDRLFLAGSFRESFRKRGWFYGFLFGSWAFQGWLVWRTDYADIKSYSALEYLRTQPAVVLRYLRLALFPDRLCLNYNWRPAAVDGGALAILSGLAVLTAWGLKRHPAFGYAIFWFFLTLLPTSSFLPLEDLAFEHRMYLPLAGAAALAGTWWALWRQSLRKLAWAWAPLALVAVLFGLRTDRRNRDYADPERIWASCLEIAPFNPRAHNNLGNILLKQGERERAREHYARSVALDRNYEAGLYNLGTWHLEEGEPAPAEAWFREAIRVNPESAAAAVNLGIAVFRQGRPAEAEALFRAGAADHPLDPAFPYNLGVLLLKEGRRDQARLALERARELAPTHPGILQALGALAR
jgi:Flp pilus assembly protein TadD